MFNLKCTYRRGWLKVALSGELDVHAAPLLQRQLRQAVQDYQAYQVVLDLGQLEFIDSAGIGGILSCHRFLTGLKGEMRLGRVAARVRPVIRLSGMEQVIAPAGKYSGARQGREKHA